MRNRRLASLLAVSGIIAAAAIVQGVMTWRARRAPPEPPRSAGRAEPSADERIAYYEGRLKTQPRLYTAHAEVGLAYLDKARESHDPSWLPKARKAAQGSLDIQENYEALKLMVAIENHSHRFESALGWARKAADASPMGTTIMDPGITASMVEAHMGLGQSAEARRLLPPDGARIDRFYVAASYAQWLAAEKRVDEAVRAYLGALDLAVAEGHAEGVQWAEVMAGGALLDNGRLKEARPFLEKAARRGPSALLEIHWAELDEAEGRGREALERYERLLALRDDPEIRRRAYGLARQIGDEARARRHFEVAEKGLRRAIDVGEVYTLGPLAALYAEAGTRLDEALVLAQRNLEYKRDREAQETLTKVKAKLAQAPEGSPTR